MKESLIERFNKINEIKNTNPFKEYIEKEHKLFYFEGYMGVIKIARNKKDFEKGNCITINKTPSTQIHICLNTNYLNIVEEMKKMENLCCIVKNYFDKPIF